MRGGGEEGVAAAAAAAAARTRTHTRAHTTRATHRRRNDGTLQILPVMSEAGKDHCGSRRRGGESTSS